MQDFKKEKINFKKPVGDSQKSVFAYEDSFVVKQIVAKNSHELRSAMHNIVLNSNHDNDFIISHQQFLMYSSEDEWVIYIKMPRLRCDLQQWAEEKKKANNTPTIAEIANILYNAACALEYLHSKEIAHQNLKPQNILLDEKNLSYLTDMRCHYTPEDEIESPYLKFVDNKRYRSPEFSNSMMHNQDFLRADIWALGVVMIDVCSEKLIRTSKKPVIMDLKSDLAEGLEMLKGKYPDELYEIISMMVSSSPEERITCKELKTILGNKLGKFLLSDKMKASIKSTGLNSSRSSGSDGDPPSLSAQIHKGTKLLQKQNFREAKEIFIHCFAEIKKGNGSDINKGDVYNGLGVCNYKDGKYLESIEMYSECLAIYGKAYGFDHPNTAMVYENMGNAYEKLGKHTFALQNLTKALEIRFKKYGESHDSVATSYNNIGNLYYGMGKYHEALETHFKALKIRAKVLQVSHPLIADSYNNVASVYEKQQKLDKALDNQTKALEIYQANYSENHPTIANCYNNLGNINEGLKRYDESLKNHMKALEIRQNIYGKNHVDVAISYNNIGNVYDDQEDYAKALENYNVALTLLKLEYKNKHPYINLVEKNIERVERKKK